MRALKTAAVALLTAMLMSVAIAVVTPAAANAAYPNCTHFMKRGYGSNGELLIPTTVPNGSWDCVLGPGNQSWGVWALQKSLNLCHDGGLVEDAKYGNLTRNMVIWVQAANGIRADGDYGPQTRRYAMYFPVFRKGTWNFTGTCIGRF